MVFAMTARDMVTQAMREIGVLASGEDPSSDELADGILRLNSMLKSYAAKGVNLWRDTDGEVTLLEGVAIAPLPDALSVSSARLVLEDTVDRLMAEWPREDLLAMPNKSVTGEPIVYAILTTTAGISMQLYPVPARDVTVRYSYARATATIANPTDAVDIPPMFQEAIWKMLAVRLAPTFGKARADPATVQLVAQQAAELERDMLDWDRPSSYYMGGDDYR